jgi:hypothetical protein
MGNIQDTIQSTGTRLIPEGMRRSLYHDGSKLDDEETEAILPSNSQPNSLDHGYISDASNSFCTANNDEATDMLLELRRVSSQSIHASLDCMHGKDKHPSVLDAKLGCPPTAVPPISDEDKNDSRRVSSVSTVTEYASDIEDCSSTGTDFYSDQDSTSLNKFPIDRPLEKDSVSVSPSTDLYSDSSDTSVSSESGEYSNPADPSDYTLTEVTDDDTEDILNYLDSTICSYDSTTDVEDETLQPSASTARGSFQTSGEGTSHSNSISELNSSDCNGHLTIYNKPLLDIDDNCDKPGNVMDTDYEILDRGAPFGVTDGTTETYERLSLYRNW